MQKKNHKLQAPFPKKKPPIPKTQKPKKGLKKSSDTRNNPLHRRNKRSGCSRARRKGKLHHSVSGARGRKVSVRDRFPRRLPLPSLDRSIDFSGGYGRVHGGSFATIVPAALFFFSFSPRGLSPYT